MDKFLASERIRQMALDFMNVNPNRRYTVSDVCTAMFKPNGEPYTRDAVTRALRAMWEHQELERYSVGLLEFKPLVKETYKAEKARARLKHSEPKEPPKEIEPWRFVHKHTDEDKERKDLSGNSIACNHNSGGQGSVRDKVYIKSCMG